MLLGDLGETMTANLPQSNYDWTVLISLPKVCMLRRVLTNWCASIPLNNVGTQFAVTVSVQHADCSRSDIAESRLQEGITEPREAAQLPLFHARRGREGAGGDDTDDSHPCIPEAVRCKTGWSCEVEGRRIRVSYALLTTSVADPSLWEGAGPSGSAQLGKVYAMLAESGLFRSLRALVTAERSKSGTARGGVASTSAPLEPQASHARPPPQGVTAAVVARLVEGYLRWGSREGKLRTGGQAKLTVAQLFFAPLLWTR